MPTAEYLGYLLGSALAVTESWRNRAERWAAENILRVVHRTIFNLNIAAYYVLFWLYCWCWCCCCYLLICVHLAFNVRLLSDARAYSIAWLWRAPRARAAFDYSYLYSFRIIRVMEHGVCSNRFAPHSKYLINCTNFSFHFFHNFLSSFACIS